MEGIGERPFDLRGYCIVQAGSGSPAFTPPLSLTLTDLTPSTGQGVPNGVVGPAGIFGHRVEKTIRMKIEIKDAAGAVPAFPVLVRLAVAGPRHGALILDPDGSRIECAQAAFLWHERDAQGNLIALNEEFEYRLGTYAPYVGVVPDPASPGGVKPVWGTGEILSVFFSVLDTAGATHAVSNKYGVHPEPGKPDHFAVSVPPPPSGTPEPVWSYWSDKGAAQVGTKANGDPKLGVTTGLYNAYYLMDRHDNVTFGYTNMTPVAPQPSANVSLSFREQTSGVLSDGREVDHNGYGWDISWHDDPAMPQGLSTSVFSVSYPTDPEWASGTVSKNVSFRFDRGRFNFLVAVDGWDCLGQGRPCAAYDPWPPYVVSPGASGDALPKSVNDADPARVTATVDAARVAFLIGSGDFIPPPPYRVFSGTTTVERSDTPAFRVSLVDLKGVVAVDGVFKVYRCPRYDHFPENEVERPCVTPPVFSVNGVIESIRLNQIGPTSPESQGYVGVELVQAPTYPGKYYVRFQTLEGKPYRVRDMADLQTARPPEGENQGAWALVTVMGGEFLDENFQRIDPYVVDQDTTAYFRYRDTGSGPPPPSVTIKSQAAENAAQTASITIGLNRLGQSNVYLAGPFTLRPPVPLAPASLGIEGTSKQAISSLVLDVFGPLSKLTALFASTKIGQADAVLDGMRVKVEWLPRGDQNWLPAGATHGLYSELKPGRQAYYGDGLKLTGEYPSGWPTPVSYQWTLSVDGQPYMPAGVDLAAKVLTFDPIQKLGTWKAHIKATFPSGAVRESPERPIYIWLETEPAAAIGWIDEQLIDTRNYIGTTGSLDADCGKVTALQADLFLRPHLAVPPPASERAFYNAAFLRCVGASPFGAIDPPRFDNLDELVEYWEENGAVNFKQGSASYLQVPVIDGRPRMPLLRKLISEARSGKTEFKYAGYSIEFPLIFPIPSEKAPENGQVVPAEVGSAKTFYLLNKSRVGKIARLTVCFINTGSISCDENRWVPFIWSKLVHSADGPLLRRDLQRTTTSFPTFRFYVPRDRGFGLRRFPLVQGDRMPQTPDPNSFINNPEDSNAN